MYLTDNPITAFRSQDISYPKVESTQVATSKFLDMIFSFKGNYSKAILYTNPKDKNIEQFQKQVHLPYYQLTAIEILSLLYFAVN